MQITNNAIPAHAASGQRPDHAGGSGGRGPQFDVSASDTEATTTTDTTAAVEPAEETESHDIPGKSVAHQARAYLSSLSGLAGHNFGWLVSQIAQGNFDESAYAGEGEGGEETGVGETAALSGDDSEVVEETPPAEETAEASPAPELELETEVEDPVIDLVDDLLDDEAADGDGSEVT